MGCQNTYSTLIQKPVIQKIFTFFRDANLDIRLVGGCVRDAILGIETHDIDFAVAAPPDKVLDVFSKNHLKTGTLGFAYGTITTYMPPYVIEVTSLRYDTETYGRQAQVAFSKNWEEDAKRRDFTINAMYLDSEGHLYDPFNGQKHLAEKKIVFIGDSTQRIQEDYLRILRYYRFSAQIGALALEPIPHIDKLKEGLKILSPERIQKEFFKTLSAPSSLFALNAMERDGVLGALFSNVPLCIEKWENLFEKQSHLLTRLFALFCCDLTPIQRSFKLSRYEQNFLKQLHESLNKSLDDVLYTYGPSIALEWSYLQENMGAEEVDKIQGYTKPKMPVQALDLMDLGLKPGPQLGDVLKSCEIWWRQGGYQANKQDCLNYVSGLISASSKTPNDRME